MKKSKNKIFKLTNLITCVIFENNIQLYYYFEITL